MLHEPDRFAVVLPGIDGTTPLGFLAALGLLRILGAPESAVETPRLSWRQLDTWRPVLHGVDSLDGLAKLVFDDSQRWAGSPLLRFRYVKQEKQGPKAVGGLKAPLAVVRAWTSERRGEGDEESLRYGAALFCDAVTEPNKKPAAPEDHDRLGIAYDREVDLALTVERSFLDLTSRNAQFLEQAELIRAYLQPGLIHQALSEGTLDYETPRTLDWDPASDTPAAIYTGYRRGYLPVHEWLGFRGLASLPMSARGTRAIMTSCAGRRLDGTFYWPIWSRPASSRAVDSLLGHPRLARLNRDERRAFGIDALFSAALTKKADGYTGTIAPTTPVPTTP